MVNLRPLMRICLLFLFLLTFFHSSALNVTVSGVVRDSVSREGVPFATVMLKGTDRGVLTDENGHYTINIPPQ